MDDNKLKSIKMSDQLPDQMWCLRTRSNEAHYPMGSSLEENNVNDKLMLRLLWTAPSTCSEA